MNGDSKLTTMFIIDLHYTVPLEKIDSRMKAHMQFLNACYEEGIFITSGRKIPRTGGIILARASTRKDLEALMQNDPFVSEGLAEVTITEFQTSQAHPAFRKHFPD